jgi:DNA-binding CsgD family transcriptional regulator
LSPNTVKSYMKLLSRKVGVSGRTGLIGRLLTGR